MKIKYFSLLFVGGKAALCAPMPPIGACTGSFPFLGEGVENEDGGGPIHETLASGEKLKHEITP